MRRRPRAEAQAFQTSFLLSFSLAEMLSTWLATVLASSPAISHAVRVNAWEILERQLPLDVTLRWSPGSPVVLVVDSEKGGVGKTGIAGGLLAVAAAAGKRVLGIDLDPRASLTAELDAEDAEFSANDLLYADPSQEPVAVRGLAGDVVTPAAGGWNPDLVHVIAAERALAHREADTTTPRLEERLRLALVGVAEKYDLVVIDLPPRAGGRLIRAGLDAATHGLLPSTLDEDGFVGATDAMKSIRFHQAATDRPFDVVGVVRNIVDRPTNLARIHDTKLAEEFGSQLLDVVVPKRVIRQEARSARVPITAASGADARAMVGAYTLILNRVAERAA